jgi:hypothetical protein
VILYRLFNQGADQISEERRGKIEAELKVVQPILDQTQKGLEIDFVQVAAHVSYTATVVTPAPSTPSTS